MSTATALQHTVSAYNLSTTSENKIHDDTVAKRFGFEGGLVPGVEVYAYMMALPVQHFGADWLIHGHAACRFQKPLYDGRDALVAAAPQADGSLSLTVTMGDTVCATGSAALRQAAPPPPVDDIATAPLPEDADRPDAAPAALIAGRTLGTFETQYSESDLGDYLRDVREPLALYAKDGIVHPGLILRLANRALSKNVRLGPWIHVGSLVGNHAPAHVGETLAAKAAVTAEYDHKGHRFVELDVLIAANGEKCVARIHHTAIYRPRQAVGG